jgi:hypothetical protein
MPYRRIIVARLRVGATGYSLLVTEETETYTNARPVFSRGRRRSPGPMCMVGGQIQAVILYLKLMKRSIVLEYR